MKKLVLVAAALCALPSAANAAAFVNGSFESGPNPGGFITLGAGSTAMTGWTVGSGSVDYIGTYWVAGDGTRSVDMSGSAAGSIFQTFDTVAGTAYRVDFLLAGNPAGGPAVKTLRVGASGNASQDYTFDVTGHSFASMGWTGESYGFTAAASSTTLTFTSLTSRYYGPALDGVTVTPAVPEPASWALMIGGFALAGAAMRRRAGHVVAAIA